MGPLRAAALSLVALVSVAACGTVTVTPPAPTPADFTGIATELTKRGLVLDRLVSGDAGCEDPTLVPASIGFTAQAPDAFGPLVATVLPVLGYQRWRFRLFDRVAAPA